MIDSWGLSADRFAPAWVSWFTFGLFFAMLAILMLEVFDTRLLLVLIWYHLSFLAVLVAMLGMAVGVVLVFVGGELFSLERVVRLLPVVGVVFALSLSVSHIVNLVILFPVVRGGSSVELVALSVVIFVFTILFVLSGFVVTLALTRTRVSIGVLYGADLLGAAVGCFAIIWLLELTDITSTVLVIGGAVVVGVVCFVCYAGTRGWSALLLVVVLFGVVAVNAIVDRPLGVIYFKSRSLWMDERVIDYLVWNVYFNVTVRALVAGSAFLWGSAANVLIVVVTMVVAAIDGDVGTVIMKWDGDPALLDWVQYDVTLLPYWIRGGEVAVIGVGGG